MPSPQFKKVKAGDPISAAEWNRMVMALERVGNILSFSGIDIFAGSGFTSIRVPDKAVLHLAKLSAQMSKDGTATAKIWKSLPGSSVDEEETGVEITAHDWMLDTGDTLASGSRVVLFQHHSSGKYYVIAAECQ